MFKSIEQVSTFINLLERYTEAIVVNKFSTEVEDAAYLNRKRQAFEEFILAVCNITTASMTTDTLPCPDCGADMALRTNRQNGNKFWGCKKYPNCKGTRDENGLSREDRERQKDKEERAPQEGGFSFNRDKRNVVTEVSPPATTQGGWINPFAK